MGCEYVDDCGNETPCYETELQCKCNCPGGSLDPNSDECRCNKSCAAPLIVKADCSCGCPQNTSLCGGQCLPNCTGGKARNVQTCACVCPPGKVESNGVCVDAPSSSTTSGSSTGTCSPPVPPPATPLLCPDGSQYGLIALYVANVAGANEFPVTIDLLNGATVQKLVAGLVIPATATVSVISKDAPLYLMEGDSLRLVTQASAKLEAVVSYEEIS